MLMPLASDAPGLELHAAVVLLSCLTLRQGMPDVIDAFRLYMLASCSLIWSAGCLLIASAALSISLADHAPMTLCSCMLPNDAVLLVAGGMSLPY